MKTKLLMTLSLTGLLGMSAISHAGGIKYGATYNVGDPIPNGDCMEMICEHGCVEEDGSFIGHCCPSSGAEGESCNTDGISVDACCQDGMACENGVCKKKTCQVGSTTYNDGENVGECGVCREGEVVDRNLTAPDCKGPCNTSTWRWKSKTDYFTKDSEGRCCINGSRQYNDSYCPGCKNMTLGNRYSMACYWYYDECVAHFGWSDTRTISVVEKNMTLKADVLHIVSFSKYIVKDETTGSYLVNKTSLSWNSSLDSTVTLQAGHTYTIDLKFENLCDHCSVTATCN